MPAWHFTVQGVKDAFTYVAVPPSATTPLPAPREGEHEEVTAFEPVPRHTADALLSPMRTHAFPAHHSAVSVRR
ncbi:hypothetical protein GCM10023075_50030 [Streptosporangium album]